MQDAALRSCIVPAAAVALPGRPDEPTRGGRRRAGAAMRQAPVPTTDAPQWGRPAGTGAVCVMCHCAAGMPRRDGCGSLETSASQGSVSQSEGGLAQPCRPRPDQHATRLSSVIPRRPSSSVVTVSRSAQRGGVVVCRCPRHLHRRDGRTRDLETASLTLSRAGADPSRPVRRQRQTPAGRATKTAATAPVKKFGSWRFG